MEEAITAACEMALNSDQQNERASKAKQFALAHGGATQRTAQAVREHMNHIKDSTAH